jgi:acetate kinase
MRVLSVNGGSSSLKVALHEVGATETRLATGAVEGLRGARGRLWMRDAAGRPLHDAGGTFADTRAAVEATFAVMEALRLPAPDAVGHRLVHGGPDHARPERVDARLMRALRGLVPFAPLHLPAEIDAIEAVAARFPGLPQVVCFDTAFHRDMPAVAARLPLRRALWDRGIRRYGFHGLSYEYVVGAVGAGTLGRAVIAHLGNGASMVAVREGRPLDTTMGLTPTGGFMMSTRSGDLDPGVLLHLLREDGVDAAALERLVDREAGLLGVSGTTADMRTLLERGASDRHAAEAVAMFCYQVRKHAGALAAVLGGLDTLVFTGGIGEHAAPVRREIGEGLAYLGVRLDDARNDAHADVISAADSPCTVRVVPTDEELMIARHARAVLAGG